MDKPVYQNIAGVIDHLTRVYQDQPNLDEIADRSGYSASHFHRQFSEYVGITPKQFIRFLNTRKAEQLLLDQHSILDVANETGLSSTSRVHDLFVQYRAMTPGDVKRKGQGVKIFYSFFPTELGYLFCGQTEKGICWLSFHNPSEEQDVLNIIHKRWPLAVIERATDKDQIYSGQDIIQAWTDKRRDGVSLDIFGTNFQIKVWEVLLSIPSGAYVTYQNIAQNIGNSKASRAVGTAVGQNPVSILIPCHRVIQSSGIVDNYAWGSGRKRFLLGLEGQTN